MSIQERFRLVVDANTPERGRFSFLEKETGVGAETWKAVWYGRQRPTAQLIEIVSKKWPQHAFWLATGMSDVRFGHLPVDRSPQRIATEKPAARRYWLSRLALRDFCEEHGLASEEVDAQLIGDVIPRRLIDDITFSRTMYLNEIDTYARNPAMNWEFPMVNAYEQGPDEWEALMELPVFKPESSSNDD